VVYIHQKCNYNVLWVVTCNTSRCSGGTSCLSQNSYNGLLTINCPIVEAIAAMLSTKFTGQFTMLL